MGVSSMMIPETYSHEDLVAWMEVGSWLRGDEQAHYQEPNPSLDASGCKGEEKSEGKGKEGKNPGGGKTWKSAKDMGRTEVGVIRLPLG